MFNPPATIDLTVSQADIDNADGTNEGCSIVRAIKNLIVGRGLPGITTQQDVDDCAGSRVDIGAFVGSDNNVYNFRLMVCGVPYIIYQVLAQTYVTTELSPLHTKPLSQYIAGLTKA